MLTTEEELELYNFMNEWYPTFQHLSSEDKLTLRRVWGKAFSLGYDKAIEGLRVEPEE